MWVQLELDFGAYCRTCGSDLLYHDYVRIGLFNYCDRVCFANRGLLCNPFFMR